MPELTPTPRDVIKQMINRLINMEPRHRRNIDTESPERGVDLLAKMVMNASIQAHPILENYFCTGKGVELQCIDSMIAESIMHKLIDKDIPSLPVHDSLSLT